MADVSDPLEYDDFKKEGAPDLYEKITDESTILGKLLSKIPGFDGYVERSRRREADSMLRHHIAARVDAARLRLGAVHQALAADIVKAIEYAEPLGRVDATLHGLAGKIHDAPTGYAGFFDAVKIKEEELTDIYNFDAGMLDHVDAIDAALDQLDTAVQEDARISAAVAALQSAALAANDAFAERQAVLGGIV